MSRQRIAKRDSTISGVIGNYRADVDTTGMDPEMIELFQTGGAGTQIVRKPNFRNVKSGSSSAAPKPKRPKY